MILDSFKVCTLVLPVPTDGENFIEEVGIRSTHFRLFWGKVFDFFLNPFRNPPSTVSRFLVAEEFRTWPVNDIPPLSACGFAILSLIQKAAALQFCMGWVKLFFDP